MKQNSEKNPQCANILINISKIFFQFILNSCFQSFTIEKLKMIFYCALKQENLK